MIRSLYILLHAYAHAKRARARAIYNLPTTLYGILALTTFVNARIQRIAHRATNSLRRGRYAPILNKMNSHGRILTEYPKGAPFKILNALLYKKGALREKELQQSQILKN